MPIIRRFIICNVRAGIKLIVNVIRLAQPGRGESLPWWHGVIIYKPCLGGDLPRLARDMR